MSPSLRLYALLVPLFFASGFAALVCQMVWQRLLTFFSGADVHSVTIIVSAFMAGLGLGSLAGGQLADRLSPGRRLLAFALAELAVGGFVLASVPLLYEVLFLRLGRQDLPIAVTGAIVFLSLLWPTFFMGISLPLLSRVVTDRAEASAERIGGLYGWNTLGAALGSVAAVWGLVRWGGFEGALRVAAALNLACALGALVASRLPVRESAPEGAAPAPTAEASSPRGRPRGAVFPFPVWLGLYALAGFVALSLEIVWFRVLGILVKSNSFTFATLLGIYLCGIGGGALLGRRLARRSTRAAKGFLSLQAMVGGYAALSLAGLVAAVGPAGPLDGLRRYLFEYDGLEIAEGVRAVTLWVTRLGDVGSETGGLAADFLSLYLGVPLLLVGPPTLLMGASFPFLQKAVQDDLARVGRRVGWLQAANIVGSTLGAGLTGLGLLHVLGTAGTLQLLVSLTGVFLVLLAWSSRSRRPGLTLVSIAATAAVVLAVPDGAALWARLHGTEPEHVLYAEDGSGLALLKQQWEAGHLVTTVHSGGLGQSALPYGGYHTILGVLPALVHPAPVDVAVIGLGSGDTAFGVGARATTRRIDCVEIVAPQLEALKRLARRRLYPGLETLLVDGRVRYRFDDGRSFLMRGGERYDVIETDALRPTSAHSGNLYSVEYFRLLAGRLKPGGLAVIWAATPRVRDTFVHVFPHALEVGVTLIGSDEPIPFDPEVLRARMEDPFTVDRFRRAGLDLESVLSDTLTRTPRVYSPETGRSQGADWNTDLFPKDEYLASEDLLSFVDPPP